MRKAAAVQALRIVVLSVLLLLLGSSRAPAVRLDATSSTALYSQAVAKGGSGDDFENRTRAFERLRLDLTDFAGRSLSLHGFLTARNDLTTQNLGETRTRLYSGYLRYRSANAAPGALRYDARLGRQWIHAGVGSGTVDGILLRADRSGWGAISLFGGTLGSQRRDRGGFDKPDLSRRLGAELRIRPRVSASADPEIALSFADTRRLELVENQKLGGRASMWIRRRLGMWTEVRHDFILDRTYSSAAGVEVLKPARNLRAWAQYDRRTPALPATSTFAFFETKPVSGFRGGIGLRVAGPYHAAFDFERTDFKGGVNTVVTGDSIATRARVDRASSYRIVLTRGDYQIGGRFESGFGGKRSGFLIAARHDFGEKLKLTLDIGLDNYDYGSGPVEDNKAASGLLAATYALARDSRLTAQIEGLNNRDLKRDIRMMVRFDQRFRFER